MIARIHRFVEQVKRVVDPGITVLYVRQRPTACCPGRLYVTGSKAKPEHGFMRCPCGCGESLTLRFVGERPPRWTLRRDWRGRVTVRPSIWRSGGCKSHFFLTKGGVSWC